MVEIGFGKGACAFTGATVIEPDCEDIVSRQESRPFDPGRKRVEAISGKRSAQQDLGKRLFAAKDNRVDPFTIDVEVSREFPRPA
jgi:hypothetical protein